MTTTAAILGQFVAEHLAADVPPHALTHAQMVIASTLGSAAVGYGIASTVAIRAVASDQGGTPEARIWFAPSSAPRLPVALAARVNAVASDAAASDDSDLRNIAHIGTVVASTALAFGEPPAHPAGTSSQRWCSATTWRAVSARRSRRATVNGASTAASSPSSARRRSPPGFCGCRRRRLHERSHWPQHPLAASTRRPTRVSHANITQASRPCWALRQRRPPRTILPSTRPCSETPRGFFETFGARDVEQVTQQLGTRWQILDHLAIKLVPGAHPYHATAEAAATAARELDAAPDEIDAILVAARSMGRHLVYHPTDLVGMAHSLPYFAAAAAVDRAFGWKHASAEKILDPVIAAIQDRVKIDPAPEHSAAVAPTCGARVSVTTGPAAPQ